MYRVYLTWLITSRGLLCSLRSGIGLLHKSKQLCQLSCSYVCTSTITMLPSVAKASAKCHSPQVKTIYYGIHSQNMYMRSLNKCFVCWHWSPSNLAEVWTDHLPCMNLGPTYISSLRYPFEKSYNSNQTIYSISQRKTVTRHQLVNGPYCQAAVNI